MIRTIEVSGFRSLENFRLDLIPGLNVLVGANGSGKTNIIAFLGFVSQLASKGLSTAISSYGGSGSVFRKVGRVEYESRLQGKITGYVPCPEASDDESESFKKNLLYTYAFEIALSEDRESVYFVSQNLKLAYVSKATKSASKKNIVWGAEVSQKVNKDGEWEVSFNGLDPVFKEEGTRWSNKEIVTIIKDRTAEDRPLLLAAIDLTPGPYGAPLLEDFRRGLVFNPHPRAIRKQEDSAKLPGVNPDGSGLSASLFALKRKKNKQTSLAVRRATPQTDFPFSTVIGLPRLIEYFQLAYPDLQELDVKNDTFQNIIQVRVTIAGPDKTQVPLAALSDGTLKWMSFVTAILTNRRVLAIEEPENYVHPTVQREAIRIIRNHIGDKRSVIVSTHSETVINSVKPNELIIVCTEDGRTNAKRIKYPKTVIDQINKTGFGLAFYLNSGALEDA